MISRYTPPGTKVVALVDDHNFFPLTKDEIYTVAEIVEIAVPAGEFGVFLAEFNHSMLQQTSYGFCRVAFHLRQFRLLELPKGWEKIAALNQRPVPVDA